MSKANGDNKTLKEIRDRLIAQGWRITYHGGHYKAWPPDKTKPMVTMNCSAGKGRGLPNMIAMLRKSGYRG